MRRSAIALAALLALTGCGGDPKADPTPSPSSSAPASPSSTAPTPPALPEAAKADTKAGAIAFVRHYIDVFNFAQAGGNGSAVLSLSTAECKQCAAVADGLQRIYSAGGRIAGGALQVLGTTADENRVEKHWIVLVRVRSGPQQVFESKTDTSPTGLPGGARSMSFTVVRDDSHWRVAEWTTA